jgi:hypothetical protein
MTQVGVTRSQFGARSLAPDGAGTRWRSLEWFAAGAGLMFAVSFLTADLLEVHHDLYMLVYATIAVTFVAAFASHSRVNLAAVLGRRLGWSLVVGALSGIVLVAQVWRGSSTTHPAGWFFVFELLWRGVVYGAVDALILFVFPAVVAHLVMGGDRRGERRKVGFAVVTIGLSMLIAATYHVGYGQFRGSDVAKPEIGALVGAVPAVVAGNPAGAVVLHSVYHVAANVHSYHSPISLPPDLHGYSERASGWTGVGIALLWILASVTLVWTQRNRLFPKGPNGTRFVSSPPATARA